MLSGPLIWPCFTGPGHFKMEWRWPLGSLLIPRGDSCTQAPFFVSVSTTRGWFLRGGSGDCSWASGLLGVHAERQLWRAMVWLLVGVCPLLCL